MIAFALTLFVFLQLKHFIVDFPLQGPSQYLNKGTYGHWGGIVHAINHLSGTGIAILLATWISSAVPHITFTNYLVVVFADCLIHYHVDWAKMNINKKLGYGPTTHEEFWWLLGLDQLLHQLTYIGLVAYLVL
jgi:hypothetical protein